jgi:hypothetical protein
VRDGDAIVLVHAAILFRGVPRALRGWPRSAERRQLLP